MIEAVFNALPGSIPTVDPLWVITLTPIAGIALLLFVENWLLSLPGTLEWMNKKSGMFPKMRGCLQDAKESVTTLITGYTQFGSKGKFFVRPDMTFKPEVMVPREYIRWTLDQPADVLSITEARYDMFALDIVLPEQDEEVDRIFLDTIHRKMTRNILKLQGVLANEVSLNIDESLGMDTENWVEAPIFGTVDKTLFSAMIRILVGESVCRNPEFGADVSSFTKRFGFSSIFVGRVLPKFLKPVLGHLLSSATLLKQRYIMNKWFIPLAEERFQNLIKKSQDPNFEYNPPQDLVTWAAENLLNTGLIGRCTPADFCRRLAIMIPAAVPTTKMTTTNALMDMLAAPEDQQVQEHLYQEIKEIIDNSEDKWADQTLIPRLIFLNSAIRETLRVNPITNVTVERKVVAKEGVTLPSGQHLPKGSWLGVPVVGIHHDESLYTDAMEYQPFRFCNRKPGEVPEENDTTPLTSQQVVNVTDSFLPFGAGKFSCPGRWFAAHLVKLTIAYLLYNYEIKPLPQRPLNTVYFGKSIPNREATMMVRRRKH